MPLSRSSWPESGSPDPIDGGYGGYFGSGKSPTSLTETFRTADKGGRSKVCRRRRSAVDMPGRTLIQRSQWVSLLCVVNGRRFDVKCDCPIKSDSNFAIYKFLLVGSCFMVGVMPPLLGLPAGKGAVCGMFRCRLLWSPLCVLLI